MNRCLRDKTLLLLHDGEGTSAERSHLQECEGCTTRYRQLELDLGAIGQVLRQEPPLETTNYRSRRLSARWLPPAVAVALVLVLIWAGVRMLSPPTRPPHKAIGNGESWTPLDEFPSNLFSLNEAFAVELWPEGAGFYDLAAMALEADRPCEWYDLSARGEAESSIEESESLPGTPLGSCVDLEAKPSDATR